MLSHVFRSSTDTSIFKVFVDQLLQHCGSWPEPKSVLVMDNASFQHSEQIAQMCADAGVKLVYLPPYLPDLNSIEEFVAELKGFIRCNWSYYKDPDKRFGSFLEWCFGVVGAREESARGHFRHAGLTIENRPWYKGLFPRIKVSAASSFATNGNTMDSPDHEPDTKAESSQGPSCAPLEHENLFSSHPVVQVQSNCHSSGF